jgi:hypothetical protein
MTAVNLPISRDPNPPRIADIIPLPVQQPGRVRRAIAALLADPSPTPTADAIAETISRMQLLYESVRAHELITAKREAARAPWPLRRWRG